MKKNYYLISLFCVSFIQSIYSQSAPLYFVTAANSLYYHKLINLIGSIHKTNFDNLGEIAVFDLGLTNEQISQLKAIKKVSINTVEITHPHIITPLHVVDTRMVPGYYAWKGVAIKQALERFPYVFWLDAGSTVLKPLDDLFKYIQQHGYFLGSVGGDAPKNVGWCITPYVVNKFCLTSPEYSWILNQECVMASFMGVSKPHLDKFILPLYELAKDLRNFKSDSINPGSISGGHDQPLLSILAYSQNLKVFKFDYTQVHPMMLKVDDNEIPFNITYLAHHITEKTYIFHSRDVVGNDGFYINWK